jgi:hypothetical protein
MGLGVAEKRVLLVKPLGPRVGRRAGRTSDLGHPKDSLGLPGFNLAESVHDSRCVLPWRTLGERASAFREHVGWRHDLRRAEFSEA